MRFSRVVTSYPSFRFYEPNQSWSSRMKGRDSNVGTNGGTRAFPEKEIMGIPSRGPRAAIIARLMLMASSSRVLSH